MDSSVRKPTVMVGWLCQIARYDGAERLRVRRLIAAQADQSIAGGLRMRPASQAVAASSGICTAATRSKNPCGESHAVSGAVSTAQSGG